MCPHNSPSHLCYHTLPEIKLLLAYERHLPLQPTQLFCPDTIVSTIHFLLSEPRAPDPDTMDGAYDNVAPGSCMTRMLGHNGLLVPVFCDAGMTKVLMCFWRGVKGWVAGLVGRGVLVRTGGDGRGGGGDRDGEGEGEEGRRWEWNEAVVAEWRGDKTRLGVWVRENLWRRQYVDVLSRLVQHGFDHPLPLKETYAERLKALRPELFQRRAEPPAAANLAPPSSSSPLAAAADWPPSASSSVRRQPPPPPPPATALTAPPAPRSSSDFANILGISAKKFQSRAYRHGVARERNRLREEEISKTNAAFLHSEERTDLWDATHYGDE